VVSREARILRAPQQLATTSPTIRYQDVHYVYVLRSLKDGNLYTGYTSDLRARIATHTAGKARATRGRRPLHLIYYEAYLLRSDAKARELFLKSGSGKRFIRKQLSHYWSS
jgi:putative endonuclease